MRRAGTAGAMVIALASAASTAWAQPASEPRFELAGSLFWIAGTDFGSRSANLTANDPGDPDFALFNTSTRLGAGLGPEARLQVRLSRRFGVEGAVSWTHHTLETQVTGDTEGAPNIAITQSTSTVMAGGDLVARTSATFSRGRGRPFVFAGGGYTRRTGDQGILAASGAYLDAGGGVKYQLSSRPSGFPRSVALRADGRVVVRSDRLDAASAGEAHTAFGAAVGLAIGF